MEERVLILAPTGSDAVLASNSLKSGAIASQACRDIEELCACLAQGAGAALISVEALRGSAGRALQAALASAPAWSDLPLIVITGAEPQADGVLASDPVLSELRSVTFIERPIPAQTLATTVQSALRARRRQYQVRDLLSRQEKAVERLDLLAEVATHLLLSDRPEEIVASVFRKIADHLCLEVYLCYLFDERTQKLRLSSYSGVPETFAEERRTLELEGTFCGMAARQRKRIVADNIQAIGEEPTAHVRSLGVTAYACFPLVANDRLIGTLSFGVRERHRLNHEELAMLETVCNQVAVAIERKRTEEALQELNQVLEKRVEERTAQLQHSNEQMEAFSYSVSHDLRAPLRAIRGFAQALSEDYGAELDETGRDYLQRMGEGAERLDRLIQDLLQYSRLGRSNLKLQPLALEAAVDRVLQQLEPDIHACDATIEIKKPLPSVVAHESILDQVIMNLLTNALKFVAPGVKPHIQIWGEETGQRSRLWVVDNGIGIAPAHHQRIFGVFERLHTTEAYPGTGIGLAIVAKGVNRLGGAAGVESAPGQGSRFWVELPRNGN